MLFFIFYNIFILFFNYFFSIRSFGICNYSFFFIGVIHSGTEFILIFVLLLLFSCFFYLIVCSHYFILPLLFIFFNIFPFSFIVYKLFYTIYGFEFNYSIYFNNMEFPSNVFFMLCFFLCMLLLLICFLVYIKRSMVSYYVIKYIYFLLDIFLLRFRFLFSFIYLIFNKFISFALSYSLVYIIFNVCISLLWCICFVYDFYVYYHFYYSLYCVFFLILLRFFTAFIYLLQLYVYRQLLIIFSFIEVINFSYNLEADFPVRIFAEYDCLYILYNSGFKICYNLKDFFSDFSSKESRLLLSLYLNYCKTISKSDNIDYFSELHFDSGILLFKNSLLSFFSAYLNLLFGSLSVLNFVYEKMTNFSFFCNIFRLFFVSLCIFIYLFFLYFHFFPIY